MAKSSVDNSTEKIKLSQEDFGPSISAQLILHNLASFITKAKSDLPLFWLRRHPDSLPLSGGYFYADTNPANWYFSPERYNYNNWPSDTKVVLKIVYHISEEEKSRTGEMNYFTIESALIPGHYLAINFDQPTQQGNDTCYPVQFISTTKVKWYRGNDTGITFSLYTYVNEGTESTKFYCSLVSDQQVFATRQEEKRITFDSPVTPFLDGPLSSTQLRDETSTREYRLFVVRFPSEENRDAYLNTSAYELSYRGSPSCLNQDSSVIMRIKRTGTDNDPEYIWSSYVMPHRYLKVEDLINRGQYRVSFVETDNPSWTVEQGSGYSLGFKQETRSGVKYLKPIKSSERPYLDLVIAVDDLVVDECPINVYKLRDYLPPMPL